MSCFNFIAFAQLVVLALMDWETTSKFSSLLDSLIDICYCYSTD